MKALLIIDMQAGSFTAETPRYQAEYVVEKINRLADKYRENEDMVIFIQHDGSKENSFIPGSSEWQILDSLNVISTDIFLSKTANDSFYKTNLEETLAENNVKEISITGCATDFCIESTIQSALVKDFNITVISDCHTTADRPHARASTIIDHYNWVWENMNPTNGKIEVADFVNFLRK